MLELIFQNTLDLTGVFGEYVVHNILDSILKLKNIKNQNEDEDKKSIETLLKNHFVQVHNWCTNIQFFGLPNAQKTELHTVELSLTTNIRRISGQEKNQIDIDEKYIINSSENILILGDPGSGKTTCLKRITQKILYSNDFDSKRFPILLRLKDFNKGDSISKKICELIGLKYVIIEEPIPNSKEVKYKIMVNNLLIEDAVCSFLNSAEIYLILDGLDELKTEIKNEIIREIELISEKQSNSKSIVSCRSGDYHKTLRYFSVCEILPLSTNQIKYIINKWVSNPSLFFDELKNKQYSELANRPLFLGHLLILFIQRGELPHTSTDVYEKTVNLLIKNWDGDRDIYRKSIFQNFDNEEKQKFLEELSYILTYVIKTKVFDRKIFYEAYVKMHKDYSLPKNEFEKVANEIESHNGLVSKSFGDNYEFSHLVLQEYLCAKYLVTIAFNPKNLFKYLIEYPAPLAICVSISREPSSWFGQLILKAFQKTNFPEKQSAEKSLASLLQRILFEKPKFRDNCSEMGLAIIYIINFFGFRESESSTDRTFKTTNIYSLINDLLKIHNVEKNFVDALSLYKYDRVMGKGYANLTKIYLPVANQGQITDKALEVPINNCFLPTTLVKRYTDLYGIQLKHFELVNL